MATEINADEALQTLMMGNALYVASSQNLENGSFGPGIMAGQSPFATVLSCSDSRIPVELVFGRKKPGELFVVRNAGNSADAGAIGSIEYSVAVLGVPLVVVMGHRGCGAVTAACDTVRSGTAHSTCISKMLEPIMPVALECCGKGEDCVEIAVRTHVTRTVDTIIHTSPIIADYVENRKVEIVPIYYDLQTGRAEIISA